MFVYTEAKKVAIEIMAIAEGFPKYQQYEMGSQLRRSATSIGANIAEGYFRRTKNDRAHFIVIARASLAETIYFLDLAKDLGYIELSTLEIVVDRLTNLDVKLHNFARTLEPDRLYNSR